MKEAYRDIIHMPHHVSTTRAQLSMEDRAAQFSPFAALTGHEAAIRETARITDARIELSEDELNELDRKYQLLSDHLACKSEIRITFFQPDRNKNGGAYVTVSGIVKKTDPLFRKIHLTNGEIITMDDVLKIDFISPT